MKISERNTGRKLVVVIESSDNRDLHLLQSMLEMTRDQCVRHGHTTDEWPKHVSSVMTGAAPSNARVIQRIDAYDEVHRFILLHHLDHDLLLGISSRRDVNVPGVLSGNLASNLLLELLSPQRGAQHEFRAAPYGEVIANASSRLWRRTASGALLQDLCLEWEIQITTDAWTFDPLQPGASLVGIIQASQDASHATTFVKNSTTHRRVAHEGGIVKFARSKTHPTIAIDRITGVMTYDLAIVATFREMADRLIDGWTFEELAATFAKRLPSYTLREEEDLPGRGRQTGRTRSERNIHRQANGRPPLPLRFLEDGTTPNLEYRPETMADLADPSSAIRKLFGGPTLPRQLRGADLVKLTTEDLGGIDPRRAYVDFFTTGVYRRLHRDQVRSGSTFSRFRWISYDLGLVDDHFILTPRQSNALAERLSAPPVDTKGTKLPLAGLFEVAPITTPLYTTRGLLSPGSGRLVFRTAHNARSEPGYRVYHEPPGATPHGGGAVILAWLPAEDLHASVVSGLLQALDGATHNVHLVPPPRETETQRERRRLARLHQEIQDEFEGAVLALKDSELSDRQRQVLKTDSNTAEEHLNDIEAQLRALDDGNGSDDTGNADVPLHRLPDVLGAITSSATLPAAVADTCRRVLRAVLRAPVLELVPTQAAVRWHGRLELDTDDGGVLQIPVSGHLRNRTTDTWIGGVGGQFWAGIPFATAWDRLDLATPAGTATRWHAPLIKRLQTDAKIDTPLRDPAAASLLVRCPDATILRTAFALLRGTATDADDELVSHVRQLFFDPTLKTPTTWRTLACQAARRAAEGDCT